MWSSPSGRSILGASRITVARRRARFSSMEDARPASPPVCGNMKTTRSKGPRALSSGASLRVLASMLWRTDADRLDLRHVRIDNLTAILGSQGRPVIVRGRRQPPPSDALIAVRSRAAAKEKSASPMRRRRSSGLAYAPGRPSVRRRPPRTTVGSSPAGAGVSPAAFLSPPLVLAAPLSSASLRFLSSLRCFLEPSAMNARDSPRRLRSTSTSCPFVSQNSARSTSSHA